VNEILPRGHKMVSAYCQLYHCILRSVSHIVRGLEVVRGLCTCLVPSSVIVKFHPLRMNPLLAFLLVDFRSSPTPRRSEDIGEHSQKSLLTSQALALVVLSGTLQPGLKGLSDG
jgi:hypothetical protein